MLKNAWALLSTQLSIKTDTTQIINIIINLHRKWHKIFQRGQLYVDLPLISQNFPTWPTVCRFTINLTKFSSVAICM